MGTSPPARDAHFLSWLLPGWIGIKIQEFNFAAKSRAPREGTEGRKTLRGPRGPPELPPRPLPSGGGRESQGSREGPLGSRLSRRGAGARRGGQGWAFRTRGNRIPFPRPRALGPAGAPPPPFRPLRGNHLPAQVLSFEALNEAFQTFLKLPPPSTHGGALSIPPPPATAAGKRGAGGAKGQAQGSGTEAPSSA